MNPLFEVQAMKKTIERFYQFSTHFVKILTFILTLVLFSGSFLLTCYSNNMTSQVVLTKWDNPLLMTPATLLILCLFLAVCIFICSHSGHLKSLLLYATLGWIIVLGCILILFSKTVPAADALSVYSAAQALAGGDTSVIHPTASYFSYYPQQVGLLAFLEGLFRIWNLFGLPVPAYHFFKGIYVLLLAGTVLLQYKCIHLLWEDDRTDCLYLLLAGTNLPMIMYSSFLYGEIPSFAAFSAGLYFLLKFLMKAHTIPSCALSLFFLAISVMLRKNNLILIIAVLLVTGLQWMITKKHILLVFAALCSACALLILPIVEMTYEHRADNELRSGVTATSYFAMGMQEASRGPGWYNGFNFDTYQNSGMDAELTNQVSRQAIRERLTYFTQNPEYALSFYVKKHLSQWADGTYASRQATLATYGGRNAFFQSVYDGSLSRIFIAYGNLYQNVLHLGALLYCLTACFFKKITMKKNPAADPLPVYIGLIGVIGGFLFHTIWEANSRYIFIYSLLLLPYAARGLSVIAHLLPSRKHT